LLGRSRPGAQSKHQSKNDGRVPRPPARRMPPRPAKGAPPKRGEGTPAGAGSPAARPSGGSRESSPAPDLRNSAAEVPSECHRTGRPCARSREDARRPAAAPSRCTGRFQGLACSATRSPGPYLTAPCVDSSTALADHWEVSPH
jgi:hypothetical protein